MSDRTDPDIEDVLASIRRLVSEDVTGARRRAGARLSAAARSEPSQVSGGEGALILTPDFRVGGGNANASPEDSTAKVEQPLGGIDPDAPYDLSTIEDAIQDLEAAIDAGEDAVGVPWEEDGSEPDGWAAEVEEAPAPTEAEAVDVEDVPLDDVLPLTGRIDPDAEEAEIVPEPESEPESEPKPEPEPEPEPVDEDDVADAGIDGGVGTEVSDLDETLIDEETLRAIVSDVLREELQGALGERITRNVRKLVRREIKQVLATREFD